MLGPDSTDGVYPLKDSVPYSTLPWPEEEDEGYVAILYMATGGRGVMTRGHHSDKILVYLGGEAALKRPNNANPGDVEEQKAALTEILQGSGWYMDEILKSTPQADDFYCERLGLVKLNV